MFGEFTLQSVLEFGGKNILHPVFLESQYAGVDLRTTRVFDYYLYNGGPIFALLPVVEDRLLDSVLIFDKERLFKTTLVFADYLQVLRQTKGFLLWQYLYCEGIHPAPYEIDTMERGLQFVDRAFPDGEYVDLKARLKAFM